MTHLATAVRRRFAAVLLFAALGASCSNDSLTAPTSPDQLDGTWRLSQMTSGGVVHNEDLNAGRFNVTFSAGILNAKADCNSARACRPCPGPRSPCLPWRALAPPAPAPRSTRSSAACSSASTPCASTSACCS